MRHVVSAERYFESLSVQEDFSAKLTHYFSNIPTTVFEGFDSIDFSNLGDLSRRASSHTSEELLEHQLFLIEQFESIPDIILKEDFLVRAGYDTVQLRLNESYLETLELLNEGVLGAVGSFLKSLVSDPDPLEMTLNIIRLVLDVIGLVPFTWAGFPIDVVANVLSALISLYKEEYFSMTLSILAAIDVTQASDVLKMTFKPIAKIMEPVLKVLCRSGSKAVALEKTVIGLKDGIIRMGQGGLIDMVAKFFKSLADFIGNTMISIIRAMASFMDTVLNFVTFGAAKHIGTVKGLVDSMAKHMSVVSGNFDAASKIISKADVAVKPTDKVVAKSGREFLAGSPQGQAIVAAKSRAVQTGIEYVDDLTKLVKDDTKFMDKVAKLPQAEQAKAIAAKVENELVGQTYLTSKRIMSDPKLAKHLAEKYGWVPGKNYLTKLAKSGDVDGVKKFFEVFVSDPKISKNLSKAELRALTPFKARPEAFVQGVKHFDDTVKMLERVSVGGAKGLIKVRSMQMRRLINLMVRLFWQKYGSLDCIIQAGVSKVQNSDVLDKTLSLAMSSATPAAVNEETEQVGDPEVAAKIAASSKADCGRVASAAMATVGHVANSANFPGSTANLGGTMNMADDPAQAAEFQEKSTDYSKEILRSLGLDDSIDVQHAIENSDPVTQAYFADVWQDGQININTLDKSRMDDVIQDMVKKGIVKPEQAAEVKRKALDLIESGEEPTIELPNSNANEGLFQYKGLSFMNK